MSKRLLSTFKWLLFALVIVFVVRHAQQLWQRDELRQIEWNFGWLILAGFVYLLGYLPSVWFWRKLLRAVGGDVNYVDTARAYYCGHLGKFIPGKVMVLVIRAGLLKGRGVRPTAAALTAAYETLAMMGIAAALAVALSSWAIPANAWQQLPRSLRAVREFPYVVPVLVVLATIGLAPIASRVLTIVATRMTSKFAVDTVETRPINIKPSLLLTGALAFVAAWACHGLSLGLTLRSVSSAPLNLFEWPVWIAAVSFATSVGFAVLFAPGGIGPREFLLMKVLSMQPTISDQQAVAAALLLRADWLIAEITAAAVLYYLVRPSNTQSVSQESDT